MQHYFIRVELWEGTPTDVRYDDDEMPLHQPKGMDLRTWNDFEFQSEEDPEATIFFDVSEASQKSIHNYTEKGGT